jgi:3-oxoacyl-[acyl-carrier-protein] synthase II
MSVAIVAFGAISALGEGTAAVSAGEPGEGPRLALRRDPELESAGLARPFAARARIEEQHPAIDRATALLSTAMSACARELDRLLPGWRHKRVGLAVGTSSGGMRSAERAFDLVAKEAWRDADPRVLERAFYFAPVLDAAEELRIPFAPATVVLGACAASALAIGLGKRWLEHERCDLVLAGGFDAVSVFVAAGFEVLRATTATLPPRPFRVGRDGMALGEGAAILALVSSNGSVTGGVHVTGFGASSDAVHLTAPDRTGSGLARAAARALEEAGRPLIDLVSAHGTATPFSDPAEARAIAKTLGVDAPSKVTVHAFKAQIGHTLGASAVLETLVCKDALERGVLPATAGEGPLDPDARVRLLAVAQAADARAALKLSAAFGGANAALVLSKAPVRARRKSHPTFLSRAAHVTGEPDAAQLAKELGQPLERLARADPLTRLALAAVGRLASDALGLDASLAGTGIVVGGCFATLETNAAFHARIVHRGARMAEPRRFPYTSPNAAAGECGVAFGFTGPGFGVGTGPGAGLEALCVAADLVRSGDAESMVVVAVDVVGATVGAMCARLGLTSSSGAVSLVVSREPRKAAHRLIDWRLELGPCEAGSTENASEVGHRALLPLTGALPGPLVLEAGGPLARDPVRREAWALRATARLIPV